GGTMNRPALQRLLADTAAGKIDIVVVYKIDRLTRSLLDFAKIVEIFDGRSVSFVSVTQAFNTTTSMGRLTLNVLLSFAQFEREVTSERIRDKIAASKKKGMWMGGAVPLGYDAIERKLKVNTTEAKTVKLLFDLYLKLGSVRKLQEETQRLGLKTKHRTFADGRSCGGGDFSRGHLYRILSSPIYLGRIPHHNKSYEGDHEAIIDAETWEKAQAQLNENAGRKRGRANAAQSSLLAGLIFTEAGNRLTPSHAVNHRRRYRYYVEQPNIPFNAKEGLSANHREKRFEPRTGSRDWRLPAHVIENLVLKQIGAFLRDRTAVVDAMPSGTRTPDGVASLITRAERLAEYCASRNFRDQLEIISSLVKRIALANDAVIIEIKRQALTARLLNRDVETTTASRTDDTIRIDVPVKPQRRGVEATLIVLGGHAGSAEPDRALVKLLVRAHDWFGRIVRGEADGFGDIARAENVDRSYVTRVVNLAFLPPKIAKAILEGRQPTALTAKRLLQSAARLPQSWVEQEVSIGFVVGYV
ncbi:MAG: recombinase family protein, partial [Pseudomonadota bacterium]